MPSCIVCGSASCRAVLSTAPLPVLANRLSASAAEARAVPRRPIDLVWCEQCQHIFNAGFDPTCLDYAAGYENALHFSPHFRKYLANVAGRLVEEYGLRHKRAMEIGCGDGYFLTLLHHDADMSCIGYDPSQGGADAQDLKDGLVRILPLSRGWEAAEPADLVCARHVLEHVEQPVNFLVGAFGCLRGPDGIAYVEVPNGRQIVVDRRIWDLIYEHVSYFTPRSLARAAALAGGSVVWHGTSFGEQFLWLDATREHGSVRAQTQTELVTDRQVEAFARSFTAMIAEWRFRIERLAADARRVVIWGAGSKGISFLNMLGVAPESGVPFVVDLNPRKTGRFVPGTGQRVIDPRFLTEYPPDVVIVMNKQYSGEIAAALAELDLTSEIVAA